MRMIRWKRLLIATTLALPVMSQGEDIASDAVRLKTLPAGRFVYLDLDRPYWEAGPVVNRVRDLMVAHTESGPIQLRFAGDPSAESQTPGRSKVGFVASGDWGVEAPFREMVLEAGEAAGLSLEGQLGTATQRLPAIRDWMQTQGLEPSGSVVELLASNDDPLKPAQSEIFLLVRGAEAVPVKPPISPPTDATVTPASPPRVDKDAQSDQDSAPRLSELWTRKDYAAIADRLISDAPGPMTESQIWLGQVVYRVGAIAKGLRMMYPDASADLTIFADTLMDRLKIVAPNAMSEARKRTVVQVDATGGSLDSRRARALRGLDMLLGKTSSRSIDPEAAAIEVGRLLEQLEELARPASP